MKSGIIISAKNLQKSFGDNHVLQGIDIEVKKGTMLALLGPNGAGKSTTVRILSTLLRPDAGELKVMGKDVVKQPDEVRKVIGLTGQSAALDELLTGRENLVMMGRLYRLTASSAKARAQELLEEFDLTDAANRPVKTYSGGMRRRLDLAVSLIATPPVIFLDEPTTGLDPRSRLVMWDIIKNLMKKGTTILLTTQYLEEADQLADDIVLIDGGKVIAKGTAKELKAKVGRDRLVLTFADSAVWAKANTLLAKKIDFADKTELQHTLLIDGSEDVRQILDSLAGSKLSIASLDIHKPTLDDVFLTYTKKPITKQEETK
jgi:ABC-2 type transport system ATP-binding protein